MIRVPHRSTMMMLLGVFFAVGCPNPPDLVNAPLEMEPPQSTEVPRRAEGAIIGVEVYESEREFPGLFEEWRALGVTTVFAGEELTSSGGFRALARKNDTDLFIIFPVFFVPEALAENPDLRAITADGDGAQKGRVEFVCPSRRDFRDRRVEDARMIVKRLRPEGLSIDVLSQYVFWEAEESKRGPGTPPDTCYCVHCLQAFASFLGVPVFSIPPLPQRAAAWIEANAADSWVRFKAQTITSMAEEIAEAVREIEPDILINIDIVLWRGDESDGAIARAVGQDEVALGEIADLLSPMACPFRLECPPEWVASVVQDLAEAVACPVLPSIRVSPADTGDGAFSGPEFESALRAALESPSVGVVLRAWDDIDADPERAVIVRRVILDR